MTCRAEAGLPTTRGAGGGFLVTWGSDGLPAKQRADGGFPATQGAEGGFPRRRLRGKKSPFCEDIGDVFGNWSFSQLKNPRSRNLAAREQWRTTRISVVFCHCGKPSRQEARVCRCRWRSCGFIAHARTLLAMCVRRSASVPDGHVARVRTLLVHAHALSMRARALLVHDRTLATHARALPARACALGAARVARSLSCPTHASDNGARP